MVLKVLTQWPLIISVILPFRGSLFMELTWGVTGVEAPLWVTGVPLFCKAREGLLWQGMGKGEWVWCPGHRHTLRKITGSKEHIQRLFIWNLMVLKWLLAPGKLYTPRDLGSPAEDHSLMDENINIPWVVGGKGVTLERQVWVYICENSSLSQGPCATHERLLSVVK